MKFNLKQIYIAVEGVTGCGKHLLATKLAKKIDANLIKDNCYANPFLKDFYRDPESHALPLQLFYLVSRYNQQTSMPSGDLFHHNMVSNYIFNKDQIYASFNLDDKNLTLYNQILKTMSSNIQTPDLVIYLHAPDSNTLLKKIRNRNRALEKDMNEKYIEGLNKGYHYFFDRYNDSPLLIINIENLDLENEEHFNEIFSTIEEGFEDSKYLKL